MTCYLSGNKNAQKLLKCFVTQFHNSWNLHSFNSETTWITNFMSWDLEVAEMLLFNH
jgi:hypothetical protein